MTSRWRVSRPLPLRVALGCASSRAVDPDIVRPGPGQPVLEALPGPMLGPYDSYSDALLSACGKILSKPHASAGRPGHQESGTFWRVSSEYCAWVYYTPDDQYFVSKLTDQSRLDPLQRTKTCLLPSRVEDSRHPSSSIKYIYALHNHPYGSALSKSGIRHDVANPTCDGFHQYVPVTGQIMRWTQSRGR